MDPRRPRGRLAVLLTGVALATAVIAGSSVTVVSAAAPPLPACSVGDKLTKYRALSDYHRSILDSYYRLSSTYKPTTLVSTSNAGLNGGYKVRKGIVKDLKLMAAAARKASARFSVQSAYRSYSTQKSTFAYWVKVHGYAVALKESARPGHSEHQLGTTVDLRTYGGKAPWDVTDWGKSKAGKWLAANSWKYGFILSYPKGKTAITCYTYEPWHFRYVGRTTAKRAFLSKLTLREYLWAVQTTGLIPTPPPTATPGPTPTPTPTPEPTPTPTPTPTPEPTPES
jgi:zinc D-Ala-D-Ala carboxypeptidase